MKEEVYIDDKIIVGTIKVRQSKCESQHAKLKAKCNHRNKYKKNNKHLKVIQHTPSIHHSPYHSLAVK